MNRPLVEVELAFVLREPLVGPSVNAADVIRATDFVLPVHRDRRHPSEGPGARRRSSTASPTPPLAGWSCWGAGQPA